MIKIHALEWEDDDPIFDFKLLGLNSLLTNDYEFAFYLNKNLSLNFKRIEDQIIIDNQTEYSFSVFRLYHLTTKQEIELISNYSYPQILKSDKLSLFDEMGNVKILIPGYESFNFFLKLNASLNKEFYVTLQNLNKLKDVQEINTNTIKTSNLENLILPT